ncbi:hypothetical protein MNBD_PLANCTO02-2069 [hydrothermal vent metagenome]|uniref:Rieske domain-containing protein n=1 Tax=hydrothermal vent metagenome TaxID=652676 RepID=A0A3B1D9A7_9ZZZZ
MKRRTLLGWICQAIAISCTAIVAFPAVQFVIAPLKKKKGKAATLQRVAQLPQLKTGEPQEFAIVGSRRDAWTVYANGQIGRVWLILRSEKGTPAKDAQVDAYSSVCPHLRCFVQMGADKEKFFCPCHKAVFQFDGEAVSSKTLGYTNPTPRGMDALECQVVQDEKTKEWWVEVKYEKFKTGLEKKVVET